MVKVTVLDFGIGNLYSVCRAVENCGGDVTMVESCPKASEVERLILPGVGAFGKCLDRMQEFGAVDLAREFAETGRPMLGICVGMQALFDVSEEFGEHPGIGLIPGRVRQLQAKAANEKLKLPHIGWAPLERPEGRDWNGTILQDVDPGEFAYFVHSYHGEPENNGSTMAVTHYGPLSVTAAANAGNVTGVQFHPERSGPVGMKIISRFLNM